MQGDFENITGTERTLGIRVIWRIFGTFNNMINELGLLKHDNYFKPNNPSFETYNNYQNIIEKMCKEIILQGRNVIGIDDFKKYGMSIRQIRERCERDGIVLEKLLDNHGCLLRRCGCGMIYKFDDGEVTESKYEYEFSKLLRSLGYEYSKDYFRSIPYKLLDSNYNGNMNCDYKIITQDKIIYIELAGFLGNTSYTQNYINDIPIKNSNSKELYRQKLKQKKELLERNNLNYSIILPPDMNETVYRKILNA